MGSFFIFLSVVTIFAIVALIVLRKRHNSQLEAAIIRAKDSDTEYTDDQLVAHREANAFWAPDKSTLILSVVALAFLSVGLFNKVFFYAEPGFIYHVRTITGEERVISGTGYYYKLFGRVNDWKREMSVQAVNNGGSMDSENESSNMSASLPPLKLTMLDQVDAKVQATARFQLPIDREAFLDIAHSYRTPENLLRTSLIPQFQETLKATSSLMGAEKYYSGGRTEFQNEFETQMMDGIYVVKRIEKRVIVAVETKGSANATKGEDQDTFGEGVKTVYVVEKILDDTGNPVIKTSKSKRLGILVVEARVTDLDPNVEFAARMKLKQKASADRAIAKEQRIQEEEQKFLAIARGDREVAERQAKAKVEQIEKTTNAETEKQLALTKATKLKEAATIEALTAKIVLGRDKTKAKSVKVLADAEAYKKKAIIKADNALAQKLATEIKIQQVWAAAYAKRAVPQYVFGSSDGGTPTGGDSETANFMKLMTVEAAKSLNYNRNIDKAK